MLRMAVVNSSTLALVAGGVGAAGLLAPPAAHAERICSIPGAYMELRQANNYTIIIEAHGTTVGPRGLSRATPSQAVYGTGAGMLSDGRIAFHLEWDEPFSLATFSGTIDDQGVAHGTSEGKPVPINLWQPGTWDSTTVMNCAEVAPAGAPDGQNKPLAPPTFTADPGLTGVTFRVTDHSGVASQCTYSSEGFDKQFGLPANATVDVFVPAIRQFRNRTGTITCDNKTSANTTVFY